MESLFAGEIPVPVYQIILLLSVMTLTVLAGYLKLGLFLCYVFVFYWGNILNIRTIFGSADPNSTTVSFLFAGFGLIIIFLAMLGFLLNRE